jgi:hypothetical protein
MTKPKIYLSASTCNIKSEPCIENETRVREAEGILKIEVPDNVMKIVIVKGHTKMDSLSATLNH